MKKTAGYLMMVLVAMVLALAAAAQAGSHKAPPAGSTATGKTKVYYCAKCERVQGTGQKCEQCGGPLQAVNAEDIVFVCDMCQVTSPNPGKCPKCGMEMKPKIKAPETAPAK